MDNTCDNNSRAGIHTFNNSSRVEGNRVSGNQNGIRADSPGNLIIKNMADGNGTNFVLVANNEVGVIVSPPLSAAISGFTGGVGVGTTDPWANFSY
jgi:parallel beta-helix repeat protein